MLSPVTRPDAVPSHSAAPSGLSTSTAGDDVRAALSRLTDALAADLEAHADRIVARIRAEVPSYAGVPATALRDATLVSTRSALATLTSAAAADLDPARAVGAVRAAQGVPIEDVLHAHRVGVRESWAVAVRLAEQEGLDPEVLVAASELVWAWADRVMIAVATEHRSHDQRREHELAGVHRELLTALFDGQADLGRARVTLRAAGLDPDAPLHPLLGTSARPEELEAQLRLAVRADGVPAVLATSGHLVLGLAARPPRPDAAGAPVGVGSAAPLAAMTAAAGEAERALQALVAAGTDEVRSFADLGVAVAVAADDRLGAALHARWLAPLERDPRHAAALRATLEAWLEHRLSIDRTARALGVHPNSVRNRLRRCEELTGRSLSTTDAVVEVWWAARWPGRPPAALSAPGGARRASA